MVLRIELFIMRQAEAVRFPAAIVFSSIDKKLLFSDPLDTVKKELAFFLEQRVPQVKFVDRTLIVKITCNGNLAVYLRPRQWRN